MRYLIIGLVIGAIGAWFFAMRFYTPAGQSLINNQIVHSETIDSHFIEQMIPHHEDAITMARIAQKKAKRDEVKLLASNIIESQGKEIDEMKTWYKSWFGKNVPVSTQVMGEHGMKVDNSTHMGMMGDSTDLTTLEAADDFDTTFVEEMIPHHQMAIMMANMLKTGTNRPEMEKLAEDIIAAQTSEIDQMREWLKEWKSNDTR